MTVFPSLATRLSLFVLLFLIGVTFPAQAAENQERQQFIAFLSPRPLPPLLLFNRQTSKQAPLKALIAQKQAEGFAVLLHIWSPSCPPCLIEMKEIAKNFELLKKAGIYVFLIADVAPKDPFLEAILWKHHWDKLPHYLEGSHLLLALLQPRGVPVTYLISDKKQITARKEGEMNWSALLPSEQKN